MNEDENRQRQAEEIVEKIKDTVRKGNVARILLKRNGETILNIPLNAGIAGTILGIAAAPWALIASAIATLGFDCAIELLKTDGSTVQILSRDVGQKAMDVGAEIVEEVRDSFHKDK